MTPRKHKPSSSLTHAAFLQGVRPVVVYGGAEIRDQLRELEKGADILVATPGTCKRDFVVGGDAAAAIALRRASSVPRLLPDAASPLHRWPPH